MSSRICGTTLWRPTSSTGASSSTARSSGSPSDCIYEDLLFSAQTYLAADGIAVVALRDHGAAGLARRKDAKFIDHDLPLYLRDLRSCDPGHRGLFAGLARTYLVAMDDAVFYAAGRIPAIAALMIREDDVEAAMAAVDLAPRSGPVLPIESAERDGRVYWTGDHIGTELGRSVLDVTDMVCRRCPPTLSDWAAG